MTDESGINSERKRNYKKKNYFFEKIILKNKSQKGTQIYHMVRVDVKNTLGSVKNIQHYLKEAEYFTNKAIKFSKQSQYFVGKVQTELKKVKLSTKKSRSSVKSKVFHKNTLRNYYKNQCFCDHKH